MADLPPLAERSAISTDRPAAGASNSRGTDFTYTSPGSLLPALEPSFLQKVFRQDPWEPQIRAFLRGRDDDLIRSQELCEVVGAHLDKKNETGRIKKILEGLGWTKSVQQDENGEAIKAYAKKARAA